MRLLYYFMIMMVLLLACQTKTAKKVDNAPPSPSASVDPGMHVVVAKDVIQTSGYTYLLLKEGEKEYWAAVTRFEAEKGKTYYYKEGMEMVNFKSKELNRVFETIQFIMEFSDQPIQPKKAAPLTTQGRQMVPKSIGLKIEPANGGITLSELFANKSKYAGKKVIVKGQVIKFSPEIMNKNWIHLQDGTEADGAYDLTITTMETTEPGSTITVEGTLVIDKDFGYGYKYEVLLEDAKLIK